MEELCIIEKWHQTSKEMQKCFKSGLWKYWKPGKTCWIRIKKKKKIKKTPKHK